MKNSSPVSCEVVRATRVLSHWRVGLGLIDSKMHRTSASTEPILSCHLSVEGWRVGAGHLS